MKPSNVGRVRFIFLVVIFCVFVVSYATLRILTGDKLAYSEYPFVELDDYKPNTTRRDRTVSSSVHRNETRRNVTVTNWTDGNLKTILFYNSFFHWKGYMFGLGVEPFKSRCHRSDCRTTLNRSEIDKADVVVFFGRLLSTIAEIPKRRNDRQLFLYLNTEPPPKAYGVTQRLGLEINITVSYRRDSFIRWPYAVTLPKTKEDSPYVPLSEDQLANKTRPVAWMVSRCNRVSTVRSEYVRELTKYIQVDIYGACGNYSLKKYCCGEQLLVVRKIDHMHMTRNQCREFKAGAI